FFFFFLCTHFIFAQQYDPLYTQYMFNSLAINPAYAGTSGVLNAMAMTRHQWVGFEDAPNTQTFSLHSPIASKNIGAGLSLVLDHVGPVVNTNFSLDYSWQLLLTEKVKLSFGLKGSISSFRRDLSKYFNEVGNDQIYYETPDSRILPNFGFGLYCYGEQFYAGAAMPRIIQNIISDDGSVSSVADRENRLYILMAGGVFNLGTEFKLKPSFMFRASNSAPVSCDLNLNLLIKETVWVGGMFRPREAFGAILQGQLTNQLRIGYAFEMMTNKLMSHHRGTHEIMISYDFIFKKDYIQNPRYF
ncbi:MAG: type IX secretion system membrane protein PorP/SprF, partial [Cytophagaceae bacterium]|nr:type IX secretion system membrane protein PorP/SprF [Cytophagaceae bacterium]